jgi:hypothetical protein
MKGYEAWIKDRFFVGAKRGAVFWKKMPNEPNKIMPGLCTPTVWFPTAYCWALLMPRDFMKKANGWILLG